VTTCPCGSKFPAKPNFILLVTCVRGWGLRGCIRDAGLNPMGKRASSGSASVAPAIEVKAVCLSENRVESSTARPDTYAIERITASWRSARGIPPHLAPSEANIKLLTISEIHPVSWEDDWRRAEGPTGSTMTENPSPSLRSLLPSVQFFRFLLFFWIR